MGGQDNLLRNTNPALAFAICAFIVRIPLLFDLGLHLDEQTFLNIGHDVARGHLPYLHTWDNKPPLLFILISPITIIAQHQIWIIRVFATALDVVTGILIKRTADRLFGENPNHWVAAVWWFAAITVRDGGGALMSETVAFPFLMGGTLLLCKHRPPPWQAFFAGLLLGIATLVRMTPAFPAIAVVVTLAVESVLRRKWVLARDGGFVALGGLCALCAVVLPYVIAGETDMLVRSTLFAPVAYVDERGRSSLLGLTQSLAQSASIGGTFLFAVPVLIWCVTARLRPFGPWWRVAIMLAATLFGVTQGPAGAFYLISAEPFACVFAAQAFSSVLAMRLSKLFKFAAMAVLMAPLLVSFGVAIKRGRENSAIGETRAMLNERMKPNDTLYLTTDYLLYWLLERTPPHPIVTHAGNLFRPGMFRVLPYGMKTSGDVMQTVIATRPTWIVFGEDTVARYSRGTEVGDILQPVLESEYEREPSPKGRMIYRLRASVNR